MTTNSIQHRRHLHFQLSSQIALLNNAQLCATFDAGESSAGWGRNHTLDIGDAKVFVKRIAITNTEYDNMFSTKNLYNLPMCFHFGVGSAGFGVFRELVAHIRTTNWVLGGEIETFPLLYHYRIMPFSGPNSGMSPEVIREFVEYWGGDENIGRYMLDRASAGHELVLFLEHIPHVLQPWLLDHSDQISWALDDLFTTINFLRRRKVVHFDAHFNNLLTDGERVYLSDFGLLLDRSFSLDEVERAFLDAHIDYDYGKVISHLIFPLLDMFDALPQDTKHRLMEQYGVPIRENNFFELLAALTDNIEDIHTSGAIRLNEIYLACVVTYRPVISLIRGFLADLRRNNKKDTKFPHAELRQLLVETGVISDTGE